jgi:diamine N-acetyltransferase
MLEIRKAIPQDAAVIALLGRVTFTETFGHLFRDKNDLLQYYERTFSVEKIENSLKKFNNIFWIAFFNRLPVGYAKLKLDSLSEYSESDKTCQLQKIYLLHDFHSLKIGYGLEKQVLSEARERSFNEIWLSVLNTNYRAISFYEKSDFVKAGTHTYTIGKETFLFNVLIKRLDNYDSF